MSAWSNFYVMVGSASAALTGLMFIVITLIMGVERRYIHREGIATFTSPSVLHFCAALLVSAVLLAPWQSLLYPSILLGIAGLYGIVSALRVAYRTMRMTTYRADLEDWIWYTALPFIGYALILTGAIRLAGAYGEAGFLLGSGAALQIFVGIHNAWDVVTYITVQSAEEAQAQTPPEPHL